MCVCVCVDAVDGAILREGEVPSRQPAAASDMVDAQLEALSKKRECNRAFNRLGGPTVRPPPSQRDENDNERERGATTPNSIVGARERERG